MPKVLFLYSNPDDSARIRLDKEHRVIERVVTDLRLDPNSVRRLHAVTITDVIRAVQDERYDIVHFSGHGSPEGIFLESEDGGAGSLVSTELIGKALRQSQSSLRAAVFMSCFSAEQVTSLLNLAPYLVTVVGEADDSTAITFVHAFYRSYFATGSIETAFRRALLELDADKQGGSLKPVLSRRGLSSDKFVVQVFLYGNRDTLLVDLTEAKDSIAQLGIASQDFLSILTRKIRLHRWIFESPAPGLFLPIGPYFGLFSWSDGQDVIHCHKVVTIRDEIDQGTCNAWVSLVVRYNDLRAAEYRSPDSFSEDIRSLKTASGKFNDAYAYFFEVDEIAQVIQKICPQEFKLCKAALNSNLWMAETKMHEEDAKACIQYLEVALSTLHDLIDALAARILKPSPQP